MAASQSLEGLIEENLVAKVESAPVKISARWQPIVNIAWVITATIAFGLFLYSIPSYFTALSQQHFLAGPVQDPSLLDNLLNRAGALASFSAALLSLILAVLLFFNRKDDLMAAYVSFYLLGYAVIMPGPMEVLEYSGLQISLPVNFFMAFLFTAPTIALFCIFPNGRFVPRWTRWLVVISIPFSPLLLAFMPESFIAENSLLYWVSSLIWLVIIGASVYAMIYRYKNVSLPAEKQQTKWLVYGMVAWITTIIIMTIPYMWIQGQPEGMEFPVWAHMSATIWFLSMNIVPVALTISITRSHIWDIDLIVNRTLVYAALTLITMAIYIFIVGYIGDALQAGNRSFIAFLTAGLVAVIFQPLREALQRIVNRLMYGERDDPYTVLTQLGQRLEASASPENVLPTMVETIALALKLPYVAVELNQGDHNVTAASYGLLSAGSEQNTLRLPLRYQELQIGCLIMAARHKNEAFTLSEQQLLGDIARQVGVAAHAVMLTADLQRSRQRLVTAREEERRRLRRDLHDDLGPQLASMTLKMDAAGNFVDSDPQKTKIILAELKGQTKAALDEIRRIAYNLRPPALDEMGLVPALREYFASHNDSHKTRVSIEIDGELHPLPAAVEVAAYRIAMEAISNCLQHADAKNCYLRVKLDKDLGMEIWDDGVGVAPGEGHGIGLNSMKERAEELGGTFIMQSSPGSGTHIFVTLPVDRGYGSEPGERSFGL
jgi:signal transduction histidine kinase